MSALRPEESTTSVAAMESPAVRSGSICRQNVCCNKRVFTIPGMSVSSGTSWSALHFRSVRGVDRTRRRLRRAGCTADREGADTGSSALSRATMVRDSSFCCGPLLVFTHHGNAILKL